MDSDRGAVTGGAGVAVREESTGAPTKRTVWGHWPILLSVSIAVGVSLPLASGLLTSNRSAAESAGMRRSAAALVPIVVLIGLSALVARFLPQTTARPWVRHVAMWASFGAVLAVAITTGTPG